MSDNAKPDAAPYVVKPCPFCGSGMVGVDRGRCVECKTCGATGPEVLRQQTARDAEIAWNKRAEVKP